MRTLNITQQMQTTLEDGRRLLNDFQHATQKLTQALPY
jgi:hypothetical protein